MKKTVKKRLKKYTMQSCSMNFSITKSKWTCFNWLHADFVDISQLHFGQQYLNTWHTKFAGESLEYWINDGLMTIFFLLIGLELKRNL
jgi:NhaA family Na+:H+ antiporter